MSEKLTFAQRVERMQAVVGDLRQLLEIIEAEAAAMAQAQTRFEGKRPKGRAITS